MQRAAALAALLPAGACPEQQWLRESRKVKDGWSLRAAWEAVGRRLFFFDHTKPLLPRLVVCTGLTLLNWEKGLSGTCIGGRGPRWSSLSALP